MSKWQSAGVMTAVVVLLAVSTAQADTIYVDAGTTRIGSPAGTVTLQN